MKEGRLNPASVLVEALMLLVLWLPLSSCRGGGSGDSGDGETGIPDVVGADIADEDPATEGIQVSFWYGAGSFDVQLVLDGSVSPSPSESILFRSSPLPSYLSLNETTGVITVTPDWSEHSDTVEFWSEGVTSGDDTSDTPLRIDFSAVSS
jgi:hypothetical protein